MVFFSGKNVMFSLNIIYFWFKHNGLPKIPATIVNLPTIAGVLHNSEPS